MIKGYCLSLIFAAVWILGQIVIFHLFRPVKKFQVFTLLFLASVPLYVLSFFMTPPDLYFLPEFLCRTPFALGLLNGLIVYLLFYCTWGEVFYYIDRPLTFQMLIEVLKAPGGLKLSDLQKVYSVSEMIRARLESMVLNGYLRHQAGGYTLTDKGRFFARAFLLIRKVLGARYYLEIGGEGKSRPS